VLIEQGWHPDEIEVQQIAVLSLILWYGIKITVL
jgi:hypothetical protein